MPPRPHTPPDRAEAAFRLSRHPMLRGLGPGELDGLLGYAQQKTLRKSARLFAMGDPGAAMYLVLSGWIKLSRPGPAGRDIVLELAGPGSLFGELAVLCGQSRAADATALSATRLLSIDGRALLAILRAHPDAMLGVIRGLAERLARTTARIEETQIPADARLARALLRLAKLSPTPTQAGLLIDLGLSQGDLGELTGLTRESINKLLSLWRDQALIRVDGRAVLILNLAGLQEIADGPE